MIGARRAALVGLNLALLGASWTLWTSGEPDAGLAPAQTLARQATQAAPAAAPPTAALDAPPLFRPPARAAAVAQDEPAPAPPPAPNFRLAGVVWSEAEKVAIVQMSENGPHRRLRVGESVDDWTLRELSARTALVEAGARKVLMHLSAGVRD